MGTYSELYINDYPIFSEKGGVDPTVMTIFREEDKHVFFRRRSERNRLNWSHINFEDDDIETVYEYVNSIKHVRQRLDVMGFSIKNVKEEFLAENEQVIYDLTSIIGNLRASKYSEEMRQSYQSEIDLLRLSFFEDWLAAYKWIMTEGKQYYHNKDYVLANGTSLVKYILSSDQSELFEKFPCNDYRSFFRVIVEVCPDNGIVVQDITDLVAAGYYSPDEKVCELATSELTCDYSKNEKIIILTEGSTDIEILGKSLQVLYPHLFGYYSFMDFDLSNASGGSSSLVSTIKAFIGSGIRNRIIAVFDNDTASRESRLYLDKTTLSDNIKIISLPELDYAKRYPTIGPGGIVDVDINGLACSIELFFGTDILRNEYEFIPVQWKGYNERLQGYQGEIIHKQTLHKHFLDKCNQCIENPKLIDKLDWQPMHLVLEKIFSAFQ